MNKVTIEEFKKEQHGIYIFFIDDCSVCTSYIRELDNKNVDTSNWNLIDCNENLTYCMEEAVLEDIPMTRLYDNGNKIWEKGGILYETQRQELYENFVK